MTRRQWHVFLSGRQVKPYTLARYQVIAMIEARAGGCRCPEPWVRVFDMNGREVIDARTDLAEPGKRWRAEMMHDEGCPYP